MILLMLIGMGRFGYGQSQIAPYPIIFVHGLNDSPLCFYDFARTLLEMHGSSLYELKTLGFCLNHDGSDFTSKSDEDVAVIGWENGVFSKYGLYAIDFDAKNSRLSDHTHAKLSNQAAIYKQGKALGKMISMVLEMTNAKKVILIGHSMGGLAIREYLQRRDEHGRHIWWADPNDEFAGHHVAKIGTIATPHGGARASDFLAIGKWIYGLVIRDLANVSPFSEAVRDLDPESVYLNGGSELNIFRDSYYNNDVNCDGYQTFSAITGLNNFYYPENLAYSCIIGVGSVFGANTNLAQTGDGIVSNYRANLQNFTNTSASVDTFILKKPFGFAEPWHSSMLQKFSGIIRVLDEPQSPELAYEIGTDTTCTGFITFGSSMNKVDKDLYKIILDINGKLIIDINANQLTGIKAARLLDKDLIEKREINYAPQKIEYEATAGTYYLEINGEASNDGPTNLGSYNYPYTIKTKFIPTPSSKLVVSENIMNFYDAAIGYPKQKIIKLTNNSNAAITISKLDFTGIGAIQFASNALAPLTIATGTSNDVVVVFNPDSKGIKTAKLEIFTDSPEIPESSIALQGNGVVTATIVLAMNYTESYNFGNTKINTSRSKTFTIKNTGSNSCTISHLSIEGLNNDQYTVISPTVVPFDIGWGETKNITVGIAPTSIGSKIARLAIYNNSDNFAPVDIIELYGNGTPNYYSGSNNAIAAYEYWFDDQNVNRIKQTITQEPLFEMDADFLTDALNVGLHSLHIRYKDRKGKWSNIASEYFYKKPITAEGSRKITACEYWFDDNYANKIALTITPDQTITLNGGLDMSALSAGLHVYHTRYKDDAGQWSSVVSEFINRVPVVAAGARKIVASEYWFDEDYASKVSTPITPEQTVSLNSGMEVGSLSNGLHTYHVRYKDDAGQWSSVVSEFFSKQPATSSQANLITTYRYWFDTNHQAMITVTLPSPLNPYQLIRNINTCSLSVGDHTIHFQFRDSRRQWSAVTNDVLTKSANVMPVITASGPTTFCEGTSFTLTSGVGDSYLWSNGATTQTIQVTQSGKYAVTINPETGCKLTSDTTVVVVNPLPKVPSAIAGAIQVAQKQSGVTYSVSASADATSYLWTLPAGATGTSATNSILVNFGTDAVSGDIKVKGHNNCGDGPESSLSVTVIPLVTQDILLTAGWNIASANVVPNNLDLKTIFQPLIDDGKLKKVMDEAGKTLENFGAFGGWKNNIGSLNQSKGYKVNVSEARTLSLEGIPVPLPLDNILTVGWNIISYPCTTLQDAKALIQPLIDSGKLKKVMDEAGKTLENFGAFGGWKNNIGNFLPGKGYKVNVSEACTLTIPKTATKSAALLPDVLPSFHFTKIFEGNGTEHMNIHLLELASSGLQAGDEIGIFDGKQCVGAATIGADQMMAGNISIPASCNDEMAKSANGFTVGHPIGIQVYRGKRSYKLDKVILQGTDAFEKNGSIFVKVTASDLPAVQTQDGSDRLKCYPNPFSDQLTIEIQLAEPRKLDVKIYDLTGKLIRSLFSGKAGISETLIWDGTNGQGAKVISGTYLLKANEMIEKVALKK